MAKAQLKTQKTEASVDDFIEAIADESQREDARAVIKLMRQASQAGPKMWGPSIVGFGSRTLKYDSGRELDWMIIGFAPRKGNTVLYLPGGFPRHEALLGKLGKHKTGKGCLYIKHLADVDSKVLKELITQSVESCKT